MFSFESQISFRHVSVTCDAPITIHVTLCIASVNNYYMVQHIRRHPVNAQVNALTYYSMWYSTFLGTFVISSFGSFFKSWLPLNGPH
jgi:hypothetical protein